MLFDMAMVHRLPDGYISGQSREYPHPQICHLYKGTLDKPGLPMCRKGWNRDGGTAYSIWRNTYLRGVPVCKVCLRRATEGRPGKRARLEVALVDEEEAKV